MPIEGRKLLIVSNRLPVSIDEANGDWVVRPGSGGLVTALMPLLTCHRGKWIGWPGINRSAPTQRLLADYGRTQSFDVVPVDLENQDIDLYYRGFSNQSIWPLFHDLLGRSSFDTANWQAYVKVNEVFARKVAEEADENSFVWIHDYQLMLVGSALRQLGVEQHLSFFLHIPFPSVDLMRRIPWRRELIEGLLNYDHIGFQTAHDRRNFIQAVRWFLPDCRVRASGREAFLHHRGRAVRLGFYPIGIDFAEFADGARTREVARAARDLSENFRAPVLMLGIDRLDYTKGIPLRFLAFERLLERYPDLQGRTSLIQVVIPSRIEVPQYQDLKAELDSLAGRINGRFSRDGWVPIHYHFRNLDRTQLLAHYRACEIALITPLRDGMNLVAKEYCAASVDNNGVLVLSEFAGAAEQFHRNAIMVNPYDVDATANAIYEAYRMNREERIRRMRRLRADVRRNDIHRWVRWFVGAEPVPERFPRQRVERRH